MYLTTWVTRLIIANVVVFFISYLTPIVDRAFILVPALLLTRPWTIVTYMFLHAGFWHLFFNMLGLFFFGPRLEDRLGGKHFLWLYFLSGIAGAILSFFFTPYAQIIGASGGVFGVFIGFAYYWPREPVYIWGVFPIQARWLVVGMTLLALFGGFGGGMSGIAHFAHLGGFAGGFLYLKWLDSHSRGAKFRKQFEIPKATSDDLGRWRKINRESLHEVNRTELDRIRTKIDQYGVGSLTPDERAFMDRFSTE